MCHLIDNSDHWEHTDKSLSRVDFLRYDREILWRVANLSQQHYQNRLRHSDYARLFQDHGFEILMADGEADPASLRDLEVLPLAPAFRNRNPSDLAILISLFVVRRCAQH
jgi:hypothetical protein